MEKTQKELKREYDEWRAEFDGLLDEMEYQEMVMQEVEKMKTKKYVVKRPNEPPVECKKPFYFTYGTWEGYPFKGGWTMVMAKSHQEAREKHNKFFGLTTEGFGRYCTSYDYESFIRTGQDKKGNCGRFEHFILE